MRAGAHLDHRGTCLFNVWAPTAVRVELHLVTPAERWLPMTRRDDGLWSIEVDGLGAGARYAFRLDGEKERPDPASAWQPDGVHAPSALVDHAAFGWTDAAWRGVAQRELVFYELHVGSFTRQGTFAAAAKRLAELADLGVTAIELMPVAAFPGARNWGYDGVYPFAVQESYGGPLGLKALVDRAHALGLAVFLDVVYNHLGPEGNYLYSFGPYFTNRYQTPWGWAINYDGADSDPVRALVAENVRQWLRHYHLDGLRLDAVHGIYDFGARHILAELARVADEVGAARGYPARLFAESDLNDTRLIRRPAEGGYGLDGQWADDFHHALHALLTGEQRGYYADFGAPDDLLEAMAHGLVYRWRYSRYRRKHFGSSTDGVPPERFVVFAQNHDQVGNRMLGERLISLVGVEKAKLAAATVLLSPYLPLLFAGEEYGEAAPFLYFISHGDPQLVAAVRAGRKAEFRGFAWQGEPPDPQAEETFTRSRLDWEQQRDGVHAQLRGFYRELLRLRREHPALGCHDGELTVRRCGATALVLERARDDRRVRCWLNFGDDTVARDDVCAGERLVLASADARWGGSATICAPAPRVAPWSALVLENGA